MFIDENPCSWAGPGTRGQERDQKISWAGLKRELYEMVGHLLIYFFYTLHEHIQQTFNEKDYVSNLRNKC